MRQKFLFSCNRMCHHAKGLLTTKTQRGWHQAHARVLRCMAYPDKHNRGLTHCATQHLQPLKFACKWKITKREGEASVSFVSFIHANTALFADTFTSTALITVPVAATIKHQISNNIMSCCSFIVTLNILQPPPLTSSRHTSFRSFQTFVEYINRNTKMLRGVQTVRIDWSHVSVKLKCSRFKIKLSCRLGVAVYDNNMAALSSRRKSQPMRRQSSLLLNGLIAVTLVVSLFIQSSLAANSGSSNSGGGQLTSETEASSVSSQPLWSYGQSTRPINYAATQNGANGASNYYTTSTPSSMWDMFTGGLSQRQGALSTGSPFLSILPIILIAAGGFLLLLPMLTMMMGSPFGDPFGGGYQGAGQYGQYPQLKKRRSLDSALHKRSLIKLIEQASSIIEDLSRQYEPQTKHTQTKNH